MHIDRAGIARILIAPDVVQELLARKDLVRVGGDKVEEFKLFRRHFDRAPLIADSVVREADLQILAAHYIRVGADGRGSFLWPVAAQHGADARDQFLRLEGLYDIVVGAELEPEHLVKDLSLCREHNDRRLGTLSNLATYLVAVDMRQHEVQEHEIRGE